MKRLLLSLTLSTLLAACGTTSGISDQIAQVREYTKLACSFVPTVATVSAIFDRSVGESISSIGGQICAAVTTLPLAEGPGKRQAVVKGVVIKGHFVR